MSDQSSVPGWFTPRRHDWPDRLQETSGSAGGFRQPAVLPRIGSSESSGRYAPYSPPSLPPRARESSDFLVESGRMAAHRRQSNFTGDGRDLLVGDRIDRLAQPFRCHAAPVVSVDLACRSQCAHRSLHFQAPFLANFSATTRRDERLSLLRAPGRGRRPILTSARPSNLLRVWGWICLKSRSINREARGIKLCGHSRPVTPRADQALWISRFKQAWRSPTVRRSPV